MQELLTCETLKDGNTVNVGDLIYSDTSLENRLAVVVEVYPYIQSADILDETSGHNGLYLGLPGTFNGKAKAIGSIPLDSLAKALVDSSDLTASLGYHFVLSVLHDAATLGPLTYEK